MGTYALIRQAVMDRRCLTAIYRGRVRHFSPHTLGHDEDGNALVLGYQYGGESTAPLPEWRSFHISRLSGVTRNDDPWPTPVEDCRMNASVTRVDAQV